MWFSVSLGMDGRYFSNCGAYHMGELVNCYFGPRYNWSCCNNGWNCSFIGFLFDHALVENAMAKLKYVFLETFNNLANYLFSGAEK